MYSFFSNITPVNKQFTQQLQDKIDNLNKPKGSLGKLEDLALKIGLIQQSLEPELSQPSHILFGADHGIEREGVSLSPREITWQQMKNFAVGGGGVNMFCRQHHVPLHLIDVGVDYDFEPEFLDKVCGGKSTVDNPNLNRKIDYGTRNFLHEYAMKLKNVPVREQISSRLGRWELPTLLLRRCGCIFSRVFHLTNAWGRGQDSINRG